MKQEEPRNYRITIRTCTGGDVNRTTRTETSDMTREEYERRYCEPGSKFWEGKPDAD